MIERVGRCSREPVCGAALRIAALLAVALFVMGAPATAQQPRAPAAGPGNATAQATLPEVNLLVQWKWVRAGAGLSSGGPGTAVVIGTQALRDNAAADEGEVLLRNGTEATVRLVRHEPVSWIEWAQGPAAALGGPAMGVAVPPAGGDPAGRSYVPGLAPAVALRQAWVQSEQTMWVRALWAAPDRPVIVQMRSELPATERSHATVINPGQPAPSAERTVQSEVLARPGEWVTVVRSGSLPATANPGHAITISTADLQRPASRELRLRVTPY